MGCPFFSISILHNHFLKFIQNTLIYEKEIGTVILNFERRLNQYFDTLWNLNLFMQ